MRLPLRRFAIIFVFSVVGSLFPTTFYGQARSEYRAFWVDTFNTLLTTPTDVDAVVNNAKLANANAIFAQVRRRGDAWYLNSLEPVPDLGTPPFKHPFPAGFDPLQDLINKAHLNGIEVHAFVIVGAIWGKNPTVTGGLPSAAHHPFNRFGGYDPVAKRIVQSPDNWLTRTLLPDGTAGIAFQGHRFGNDFWIDLGHPDAAAYNVDVLMHLVRNYEIDGLHLDRIRYPEISVSGQTPSTGTNIGYNDTSIRRFQTVHGRTDTPSPSDQAWKNWRRDQVTNFVRRLYLNVMAVRPNVRISAALIAFGNGPRTEAEWFTRGEAYWRVYQDWRSWTEEGILDIAIPMNYKLEHDNAQRLMFEEWNEWLKSHQYNRAGMIGTAGVTLTSPPRGNAVEGVLRQTRKALASSAAGRSAAGVIHFSMASSNQLVANNPLAYPVTANTPVRSFAELASGLTSGRSVDGKTFYEDPVMNPVPAFQQPAFIPDFAWKSNPTKGHIMGFARPSLDTASVTIENVATGATRSTATDGGGFYGGVDLAPGPYFVSAVQGSTRLFGCMTNVSAGNVATADLEADTTAPQLSVEPVTVAAEPGVCSAPATWTVHAADSCLPVAVETKLADGTTVPNGARFPVGTTIVTATATDRAGNATSTEFTVTVLDAEKPSVDGLSTNRQRLWPPNHQMVDVRVDYTAADNCGVTDVALSVTSDDAGDGLADGNTTVDWEVVDDNLVRLRAERAGHDGNRTYTITVTAMDAAGNLATQSIDVIVPHDMRN